MSSEFRYQSLRLRAVVDETHDSRSLIFDIPPEQAAIFRYKPGQFLTLRLPVGDGRYLPRCYSMSSAPSLDEGMLRVTVKRVAQGRGSNWICDRLQSGDIVQVLPPAGLFTPRSLDGDFLLLAGGSGITPVFSILRSALAQQGQGRITLLYANRDERSVIFRDELKALAAANPTRLTVIHWLDSVQGAPTIAQLAELARHTQRAQAFICGPGPFMDAAQQALQGIGMADEHIHVERFASLPEEGTAAPAAPAERAAIGDAEVEIRVNGAVHKIRCGGSEPILDAALRAGLELPYSCQAGICASCMCQVVAGQVHLRHNDVLDKKDLAKAWTLACQALPMSARVTVKFPE